MRISDIIISSLRNLWRRKLRTFLTILGVIIGTASIVIMVSLGIAMKQNYMDQIKMMGNLNVVTVYPSYGMGGSKNEPPSIDEKAITDFKALAGVSIVSPILETQLKLISGKYIGYMSIRGIDPAMLSIQNLKLAEGRMLEAGDELTFLFGGGVKYNIYNPSSNNYGMNYDPNMASPVDYMNDPIKMTVDMSYGEKYPGMPVSRKFKPYKIITAGVLAEGSWEHDYYVYTTLEQAKKIIKDKKKYDEAGMAPAPKSKQKDPGYSSALVYVKDIKNVKAVQDLIKEMGYEASSLIEILDSMQKTSNMLQGILGGIGAISLLVAALGITNTMIMSIYERTKEIGVMKVIGASLPDIKKMFLTEAAMIGFLGGLMGLIVSFGGSMILNIVAKNVSIFGGEPTGNKLSIIPVWLYILAVTFTTLVGLTSGYFPALKAMKLSVLKALRTE